MAIPKPVFPDRAIERSKVTEDKCVESGGKVIYTPYSCFVPPPPPPTLVQPLTPVTAAPVASQAPVSVSGDHSQLMAAAGIAQSDWQYADFIISHESGWVIQWNKSGSGAFGLCQSLPASKMASAGADYMTNPVTQLRWCHGYAIARYGSWSGAYNFWLANKWW